MAHDCDICRSLKLVSFEKMAYLSTFSLPELRAAGYTSLADALIKVLRESIKTIEDSKG